MRQYSLHSWWFFVSKRFSCAKAETRMIKKMIEEGVRGEGSEKKPPAINPLRSLKYIFQDVICFEVWRQPTSWDKRLLFMTVLKVSFEATNADKSLDKSKSWHKVAVGFSLVFALQGIFLSFSENIFRSETAWLLLRIILLKFFWVLVSKNS